MNRASVFWGMILIVAGMVFLAANYLGFNPWNFFWPVLIIVVGVWLLAGSMFRPAAPEREDVAIPLGSAEKAALIIHHGGGRLSASGGAAAGMLLEGTFTGGLEHAESRLGSALQSNLRVPGRVWSNFPFFFGGWVPIEWNMRLTSAVPVSLELETGAGESQIDLHDVRAESISLKTGASSTNLILPAQAGRTRVQVESGVSSVEIRIPSGVAAHVSVESGLAGISVDTARFPRMGSDYQSADYETAANRVDISVRTGVGSVDIR